MTRGDLDTCGTTPAWTDRSQPGLVSVVVATYNRAALVRRTLESLESQTYRPLEIIVVDDGSTEKAEAVVHEFADTTDVPVAYIYKENGGAASARNAGWRAAEGEFIAFLDDDDEWLPRAAETMCRTLSETGADFAYSPSVEMPEDGAEWVNPPVSANEPEHVAVRHFMHTNIRPGAVMYRRSVFRSVPGFREDLLYNEDSDFVQRVAIECRAAYSGEPTVRQRDHAGSKSRNRVAVHRALLESATSTLARYPDFRRELGRAAGGRVAKLRGELVKALMESADFEGARRVASQGSSTMGVGNRISLRMGTTWPSRLSGAVSRALSRMRGLPGAAVRRFARPRALS